MKSYRVFLGLGSNVGERHRFLQLAADALRALPDLRMIEYSPVYESDPFGNTQQAKFLNAVGECETALEPERLVVLTQEMERRIGRTPGEHWGPREIDIDILLYDGLVRMTPQVTVPHPGLPERRFVLVPLRDLAPDLVHPVNGCTVEELAAACRDQGRVVKTSYRINP